MSTISTKKPTIDQSYSNDEDVGKYVMFVHPDHPPYTVIGFSSSLEKIGVELDRRIKNHTLVLLLSEPVNHTSPKHGELLVRKVMAASDSMWINDELLIDVEE